MGHLLAAVTNAAVTVPQPMKSVGESEYCNLKLRNLDDRIYVRANNLELVI